MIKHKKVYCDFFGYNEGDLILCEACVSDFEHNILYPYNKVENRVVREAVDIHHLTARGMGSTKCCNINEIPNLIALCREHHIKAEGCKETNKKYRIIHLKNIIKKLEDD
tara:strand:- start:779 stop:1108 length:330 start_codon:yes stop_codon:yes gene_type:complete